MAELETQRTLVKSPPELWAELSDPAALGRRLAEFGEIRITRLTPERTVAWEGDRASGTVELESSGWGTKVRLTATARAGTPGPPAPAAADRITAVIVPDDEDDREPPETPPALRPPVRVTGRPSAAERSAARMASRATAAAARPAAPTAAPAGLQAASRPDAEPSRPPTPATALERRGFFARLVDSLLGRRRAAPTAAARTSRPSVAPEAPRSPASIAPPVPKTTPPATRATPSTPVMTPPPEEPAAAASVPARPRQEREDVPRYAQPMERPRALDREQTMAVLSSVLDDLGAAHHRPFSRE